MKRTHPRSLPTYDVPRDKYGVIRTPEAYGIIYPMARRKQKSKRWLFLLLLVVASAGIAWLLWN